MPQCAIWSIGSHSHKGSSRIALPKNIFVEDTNAARIPARNVSHLFIELEELSFQSFS